MADISKITLPTGGTYDIKDATARSAIANINNWSYVVCSDAENTPKDVTWTSGSTTVTGTLVAASSTMYKIYLVPSTNGTNDTYDEYITVNPSGTTYKWEMFGNTNVHLSDLGNFAYADTGTVSVTSSGTNAASAVTFTGGSNATVVTGVQVTAQPTITLTAGSSTSTGAATYVESISTSGTNDVTFDTSSGHTASAITGLGTASTTKFVTSYPGASSKLVTASKYVATSATGGGSVTAGTACTMPTYSVEGEVLTITAGSANTPTSVTLPSFTSQTIATGSLDANGGGSSVLTGLGTANTANGVTGYASPTTATVLTSSVTATVPKTSATTKYLTASATGTAVGASGTETVVKTIGTGTAAAQVFTGGTASFTVNPVPKSGS